MLLSMSMVHLTVGVLNCMVFLLFWLVFFGCLNHLAAWKSLKWWASQVICIIYSLLIWLLYPEAVVWSLFKIAFHYLCMLSLCCNEIALISQFARTNSSATWRRIDFFFGWIRKRESTMLPLSSQQRLLRRIPS